MREEKRKEVKVEVRMLVHSNVRKLWRATADRNTESDCFGFFFLVNVSSLTGPFLNYSNPNFKTYWRTLPF